MIILLYLILVFIVFIILKNFIFKNKTEPFFFQIGNNENVVKSKDDFSDMLYNFIEIVNNPESQNLNSENEVTEDKVALGKMLFFDKRLSKDETQSCNTCHNLETYGVDNLSFSPGDAGGLGGRNSPTVLNAALHKTQFWDGRAKDLQEQAAGPIANPKEMGFSHQLAIDTVSSMPGYQARFAKIYQSNNIDIDKITDAIAEFEKTLVTPNAPFDLYLQGDKNAISSQAQSGYQLFKNKGCNNIIEER